ncbi:hypothetical protein FRB90_011895 [Tulasnella sp. 427]|nr:hypothetical protein FRB90_011895 [Tulasnella sp. 427]
MSSPTLPDLTLIEKDFLMFRLGPQDWVPPEILGLLTRIGAPPGESFTSVTRTKDEVSIVMDQMPSTLYGVEPTRWRCIKMNGPLPHDMIGILNKFTGPLKDAGVPIYAISTWDTDYVCVPKDKVDQAVNALTSGGWRFLSTVPSAEPNAQQADGA